MTAILKFDFQKRKQLRFFWSKFSKLHKKDPILHAATIFSLKQGETRTNSVPIPHPLMASLGRLEALFLDLTSGALNNCSFHYKESEI